jgi:hypothetical protein
MRRTPTGAKTWLPRLLVVPPSRARAEPQVCIPAKLSGYAFYHSTSVPFVQPCCHTESSQWTLAEGGKRDYVRWLPQEEGVFYSALRGVAGQKPEVCLRHITAQLGGSKDYPQVSVCVRGGGGGRGAGALRWGYQRHTRVGGGAWACGPVLSRAAGRPGCLVLRWMPGAWSPSSAFTCAGASLLLPPHQAAEQAVGRGRHPGHAQPAADPPIHAQVLGGGELAPQPAGLLPRALLVQPLLSAVLAYPAAARWRTWCCVPISLLSAAVLR